MLENFYGKFPVSKAHFTYKMSHTALKHGADVQATSYNLSEKESQLLVHIEPQWHGVTPATPRIRSSQPLRQLPPSEPHLLSLHAL